MFAETPKDERKFPATAVAIAAVAVLILIAVLVLLGRRHGPAFDPSQPQPPAAYASHLDLSKLTMSESSNMSGGHMTYLEGHVTNNGSETVTGITVQAAFHAADTTQRLVAPIQIIRMREPEIDTVPLSSAPLAPGAGADFRLIFEGVNDTWDTQLPGLIAIGVSTK